MRKIIVSKITHHETIKASLLGEQSVLFNVAVRDFNLAFYPHSLPLQSIEIEAFHRLKMLTLPQLQPILQFPKTTTSLLSLIRDLYLYGISLDECPQNTPLQKEIYQCIQCIAPLMPRPQLQDGYEYKVLNQGLSHAEYAFVERHNLEFISVPTTSIEHLSFHAALNIRSEVEAMIQDIILNQYESIVIAVPNIDSYAPVIEGVLKRYDYPIRFQDRTFDRAKKQFISLLNYFVNPTTQTLFDLIDVNSLGLRHSRHLTHYFKHFEYKLEDLYEPHERCGASEFKEMIHREAAIMPSWHELATFLNIPIPKSYPEMLVLAFNTLAAWSSINLTPLRSLLESHGMEYTISDHELFKLHFEHINAQCETDPNIQCVTYTQLPLNSADKLYVLGLSAKNFPNISAHTGIIDEAYLKAIHAYPPLDIRTKYELDHYHQIFNHSSNTTLSYATTTYEGKGLEVSYPVSNFAKQHNVALTSWPLIQNTLRQKQNHSLSSKNARELFLNEDGLIAGSISSFQLYRRDPVEYFIQYGLKLQPQNGTDLDARILGITNHATMEAFHSNLDDHAWDSVWAVFPKESLRLQMIYQRNSEMMSRNKEHIANSLAGTSFRTVSKERYFKNDTLFPGIMLRGIIDRIDENDTYIQVVDYKSSDQTLSQRKVQEGEQLQLVTYALIAQSLYQKPCLAIYYYGFKASTIWATRFSYSVTKGIIQDDIDAFDLWMKNHKYSGWHFAKETNIYDNASYFKGIRENKDGAIVTFGKPYSINATKDLLQYIYRTLFHDITSGILDVTRMTLEIDRDLDLKKEEIDDSI